MYLRKLQNRQKMHRYFLWIRRRVKDFQNPTIDFNRNNTYIQARELLRISEYMIHPTIYFKYIIRKCQQLKHLCISIWAGI